MKYDGVNNQQAVKPRGVGVHLTRLLLFLAIFELCFVHPAAPLTDSFYSLLLTQSIISKHTVALNNYSVPHVKPFSVPGFGANGYPYQVIFHNGKMLYAFPHGSSILSIPMLAALNLGGISVLKPDGSFNPAGEVLAERIIAALLMAGLAAIFFDTARLLLPYGLSLAVTLAGCLGTQVWSTASQALWSLDWQLVLLALAIYALLKASVSTRDPNPWWLASLLSWAYFVRPTSSISIIAITIYVWFYHRSIIARYVATGVLWLAGFVAYSYAVFGTPLPSYYLASRLSLTYFGIAFPNNLVGASRGLFVYVPVLWFVLYLIARYWKELGCRGLVLAALLVSGAHLICVSMFTEEWWGGWSYGARLTGDIVPWFVLLGILGLAGLRRSGFEGGVSVARRRGEMVAGIALVLLSVAINGYGAKAGATYQWNRWADCNIPWKSERASGLLVDWRYPQFLAGIISPPSNRPVIDRLWQNAGPLPSADSTGHRPVLVPGRQLFIDGYGFDRVHGVAVDIFEDASRQPHKTIFVRPGRNLSAHEIVLTLPALAPGAGAIRVANNGCDGKFRHQSSPVSVVIDSIKAANN